MSKYRKECWTDADVRCPFYISDERSARSIRAQMEEGAEMDVYIQYDSSGVWERKGRIKLKGTNTVTVPIRPRRCDHMRIRLEGKGMFRLFSVAKIISFGSDM